MSHIEILFQHGWGFDKNIWKRWEQPLSSYNLIFSDKGYFKNECDLSFSSKKTYKVCIAHSFGLHLLEKDLFDKSDLLIIISGFLNFQSSSIEAMKKKFKELPYAVLKSFYKRAFFPDIYPNFQINESDLILLEKDLFLLSENNFDINLLKKIPKIILLHGEKDKIIPFSKSEEIISLLPNAEIHEIEGAGHALIHTHADSCLSHLKNNLPLKDNIFNKKVCNNFSSKTHTYDEVSQLQKKTAEILLSKTKLITSQIAQGPILEIGCGTGAFTKLYLNSFTNRKINITDISDNMLQFCKCNLEKETHKNTLNFSILDAQNISDDNKYSLILSSMTFQWFYNLEDTLIKLYKKLQPKGILLFSWLENDSFVEWKKFCQKNHFSFKLHPLPTIEKVLFILKKINPSAKIEKKIITLTYPDIMSFFYSLKKAGSSTCLSPGKISLNQWKKTLAIWKKQECKITYSIGIGTIENE
jgi:malonyl-ACP O-methyltransferase BioC